MEESRLNRLETVQAMLLELGQMSTTCSDITEFIRAVHRSLGRIMYAANFYVALKENDEGGVRFVYFVKNVVKLGAAGGLFVSVPKGEGGKLQTKVERTDPLVAPLAKGQRVGTIKVSTTAGASVLDLPLVVLEPVEQAGIFGRAWDALRLWIK